jgi:hypothetical protein
VRWGLPRRTPFVLPRYSAAVFVDPYQQQNFKTEYKAQVNPMEDIMRLLMISVAALVSVCVAAPTVAAPARSTARTQAQCEALSVRRASGPGEYRHQSFMRDCMAGRLSERLSMTYDECERLSGERGAGLGGPPANEGANAHQRFMSDCMAGRIPRSAPPPRS